MSDLIKESIDDDPRESFEEDLGQALPMQWSQTMINDRCLAYMRQDEFAAEDESPDGK